jgi:uncharacterized protein
METLSKTKTNVFDEAHTLHELKHFLPAQSPLKDFIHHNTLHAFQTSLFFEGLKKASKLFGYKVTLSLSEYRDLYTQKRIKESVLQKSIIDEVGTNEAELWKEKVLNTNYETEIDARIGSLRSQWKTHYKLDLDALTHPTLFRLLCNYLDQGIAVWQFPETKTGLLNAIMTLEKNSHTSFFKTKYVKDLLLSNTATIPNLLKQIVGSEDLFEQYLFDQQFAHQGWSGMVCATELLPQTLLDKRSITLHDVIVLELLLELDAIESKFGKNWQALGNHLYTTVEPFFAEVKTSELDRLIKIWQTAFEWSYYDQVLAGIQLTNITKPSITQKSFQALLCIDDRECSFRRYLEQTDTNCETFGTPGFFGVEFFFLPEGGKFLTKLCPAPVTPNYLIKEIDANTKLKKVAHFSKQSQSLVRGALMTNALGFISAFKLAATVFRPAPSATDASSFKQMSHVSSLTIENKNITDRELDLQIGFTVEEMTNRVETVLKSIGLVKEFAPIVYVVGHGSSSVNNPHYSAYDCGACSGRAGSVNSRVLSFMANHIEVRKNLVQRGITIPDTTKFVGALHDTTRDEIAFYDEKLFDSGTKVKHLENVSVFTKALDLNAKERSRRLESINTGLTAKSIHTKILKRSVSLFEPRPELNHATNALCIVGRRELTKGLFLDRRSFMNSFDYKVDPEGKYLLNILNAAAPVCGGINLEYYFSRVDNQKLGAGTKLPHNVMGLFGVANGIEGDLRPGLPSQMIEVHDPLRLLIIVEHFEEVVLKVIQTNPATYEWFINEWVNLVAIHPETKVASVFKGGKFEPYQTLTKQLETINDLDKLLASNAENLPVYILNTK